MNECREKRVMKTLNPRHSRYERISEQKFSTSYYLASDVNRNWTRHARGRQRAVQMGGRMLRVGVNGRAKQGNLDKKYGLALRRNTQRSKLNQVSRNKTRLPPHEVAVVDEEWALS